MRRPDSSKQRLRLGTNQHPYGCARRRHTIAYTYGNGDSDSYSSSKSESYTEYSRFSDANADGNAHSNNSSKGHTAASPDSTSSSVRVCVRLKEFIAVGGDRRLITPAAPEFVSNRGNEGSEDFLSNWSEQTS